VLASLRGAKDTDFGIQVVGRILRVHRLLQPGTLDRTLPPGLRYGYVFLADADNQGGLVGAGERINAIRDELSKICPATIIVRVGDGAPEVQVAAHGQASLFRPLADSSDSDPTLESPGTGSARAPTDLRDPGERAPIGYPLPPIMDLLGDPLTGTLLPDRSARDLPVTAGQPMPAPATPRHPLRADAERVLKTERLPISTADLLQCLAAHIGFDDTVINAGLRVNVTLTRKTVGVFDGAQETGQTQARLEDKALAAQAQLQLLHFGYLHPQDLSAALLARLKTEFGHRGFPDDPATLDRALNLIMATQPALLRQAEKACAGRFEEVVDTGQWPATVEAPPGAERSRLNVYGVMPDGLNTLELTFARLLDAELSGAVEYWYRNEPRKPWSVGIVRPTGYQFFPDFILKVKGRSKGGGFLLVETKGDHLMNSLETIEKITAEHQVYGPVVMLKQDANGRFMTVRWFEKTGRCEEDQVFRVENLAGY